MIDDKPSMEWDFADVLKYCKKHDVGLEGSDQTWTWHLLEERVLITKRQLIKIAGGKANPSAETVDRLEVAFFSNSSLNQELKVIFRYTAELKIGKADPYARMSIVAIVWEQILEQNDIDDEAKSLLHADTVDNLAWTVSQLFKNMRSADIPALVTNARAFAFDKKYGVNLTEETDERHQMGITQWNEEFSDILQSLGVEAEISNLLCVGPGPGLEGEGIYDTFASGTVLDISKTAIQRFVDRFGDKLDAIDGDAEIPPDRLLHSNFDVYISLKTYQSSFFDIQKAVAACHKSLRAGGIAIISVPRFTMSNGRTIPGLKRTNYNFLEARAGGTYQPPDAGYPYDLLKAISQQLHLKLFGDVRFHTGMAEHYITARKRA